MTRWKRLGEDFLEENKRAEWALKLFNKSPLKQKKFKMICRLLEKSSGQVCLDIGSDNGVISLLLRRRGGHWHSADLIPETVAAIQSLVGERVVQIGTSALPFAENYFDKVVIVDFLEHIADDHTFINEMQRILKAGGELIINVPNPKQGLMRKLRYALGQTDEKHGHLRPGYDLAALSELLKSKFKIEEVQSYSRVFAELIDTFVTFGLGILKKNAGTQKGNVVTGADLKKMQSSFRIYGLIYPVLWVFAKLDNLVPWLHGNMLIVRARSLK